MKTFLLLAVSFSIALAQAVKAEDQDEAKAPKNRPKTPQASRYVAPRVTPNAQRNAPSTFVGPRVNRWQPPVNQPNVRADARLRANADMPRINRWQQPPVNQPKVQADARVRANVDPRTLNRTPQTPIAVQPDVNARKRNWENTRNWNNSNWRNRFSNNDSWEEARRRHPRQQHHHDWWRSHFTRFALFGTGYYFWDNSYWYPAYGYDPAYNTYAYNEPIYGYGDLEPAQVIANVQTELQRLGYFPYAVDGQMGPMTRAAIANYQRDNGLAITSAIDEPTLDSLGLG
jgi:putative peptidoglycan binding protein